MKETDEPNTADHPWLTRLGDMPVDTFLREYWQRKPLLIRNALATIPLVPAEELAGYSLEEEVESRILIETPGNDPLASQWQLHHGPFTESFYSELPNRQWTLLVQAVDQLHPDIHALLHQFRFIPNWRVDDIMVSYAADGGNVGPHFDYYDVFLLQAHGSRRWQLGQTCSTTTPLRRDTDCKVLTQFDCQEEWLLHRGDMLYIPPNVAHWGVAHGECITYSIGFRAPSYSDILLDLCQDVAASISPDKRFEDAGRRPIGNPGQITAADINHVRDIVQHTLSDDQLVRDWFGRYMTQSRRQAPQFIPEEYTGESVRLAPQARAAYVAIDGDTAMLYVNGEQFLCAVLFAEQLCRYSPIRKAGLKQREQRLLQILIKKEWMQ